MTDVREALCEGRMTGLQKWAVGVCVALNGLDGYDVLAMAFAAPSLERAWSLTPQDLGWLLSAGLAGMTAGSLVLAPFADRIGRRAMILACCVLMTVGMLASALATGPMELAAWRGLTGLGIGGMLASLNTIVAEYSPLRRRDLSVAMMSMGYPAGSMIGGFAAAALIGQYDWRAVFILGGVASLAMIPVVLALLPESVEYLIERRPKGALERLNKVLVRMGKAPVAELPAPLVADRGAASLMDVFSPALLRITIPICIAYFLAMLSMYFVLSWTPRVLVESGFSASGGISGSALMSMAGLVGGLGVGWLTKRWKLIHLTAASMAAYFIFTSLFGLVPASPVNLAILAILIGVSLYGMIVGLYAIIAATYPAHVRATGAGLAIGVGRFGAIASPIIVAAMIGAGWPKEAYFPLLALPMLLAAGVVLKIPSARA